MGGVTILNNFLYTFIFFAVLIVLIVLIKILLDFKKYGKRIFKSLNTSFSEDYRMDLLIYNIKAIFKDAIIIKPNIIPCDLIVLSKKNIYLFCIFSCNEEIIIDNNDFVYSRNKKIRNPLKRLNLSEFYIKENIDYNLIKIIVVDEQSKITLKDNSVELVFNKDIRNRLISDKIDIYNIDQLNDFKNIINKIDSVK